MPETLAAKILAQHRVRALGSGENLVYVDLHILHEVNTPRAFDDLRASGRRVRRPDLTIATEDHNTPTTLLEKTADLAGRHQRELIRSNCAQYGIRLFPLGHPDQGIVHVIAPELGLVWPGMTVVCCDSHTTTLGAFGALAFGIGTGQVEHVLVSQTLPVHQPAFIAAEISGTLPAGVTAKDLALEFVATVGTGGGQGSIVEYRGDTVRALSMEARMTLCNMTVEAGSKAGLIAPDDVTLAYLRACPLAPDGTDFEALARSWRGLRTDDDATFDRVVEIAAASVVPRVSWGTTPAQNVAIDSRVPTLDELGDEEQRAGALRAMSYMGLEPGQRMRDLTVDAVFVGSCTNGRIEDLRQVAEVLRGRQVSDGVRMLIVPGSAAVRRQAVAEGLDRVFSQSGADFRPGAGCSMCCGLNEDRLRSGERAASTSNRNYEGRQGRQSRTHLVSPAVAAATAVRGGLTTPADL